MPLETPMTISFSLALYPFPLIISLHPCLILLVRVTHLSSIVFVTPKSNTISSALPFKTLPWSPQSHSNAIGPHSLLTFRKAFRATSDHPHQDHPLMVSSCCQTAFNLPIPFAGPGIACALWAGVVCIAVSALCRSRSCDGDGEARCAALVGVRLGASVWVCAKFG